MKKLILFGILLMLVSSVAVVVVGSLTAEKGTCVIGPNQGSNAESLGQGVGTQAGSVCDATAEGGCGACLEQCTQFKKIKNSFGCQLCAEDGFCNPMCAVGEDSDCIVEVVPDQVNDVGASLSYGCSTPPMGLGSLFQSFTPGASPLTAVDLRLRIGGLFPETGYDTIINIRSSTPDGLILGTATTLVPSTPMGTQIVVNFELPEIEVTSGDIYVIEWISPQEGGSVLTWMGAGDDTYSGGTAFGCTGTAYNNDYIFTTYTTA